MGGTIDTYLRLTVADCKRLGFFVPNGTATGVIRWTRNGAVVASVGFGTKTTGVPVARFSYEADGVPVAYDVALRWKRSNLNPDSTNGYWYFVCPVTGTLCRNLYLVDGRFVGRKAFRALYEVQTLSRKTREETRAWRDLFAVEEMATAKYRREYYAGKLTPFGRKAAKLADRFEVYVADNLRRRRTTST